MNAGQFSLTCAFVKLNGNFAWQLFILIIIYCDFLWKFCVHLGTFWWIWCAQTSIVLQAVYGAIMMRLSRVNSKLCQCIGFSQLFSYIFFPWCGSCIKTNTFHMTVFLRFVYSFRFNCFFFVRFEARKLLCVWSALLLSYIAILKCTFPKTNRNETITFVTVLWAKLLFQNQTCFDDFYLS